MVAKLFPYWTNVKINCWQFEFLIFFITQFDDLKLIAFHTGQPTIQKCKKVRMKREQAQELAALDVNNIITTQGNQLSCHTMTPSELFQIEHCRHHDSKDATNAKQIDIVVCAYC